MDLQSFLIECGIAHLDIEKEKAEEALAIVRVGEALAKEEVRVCEQRKVEGEKMVAQIEAEGEKLERESELLRQKMAELMKKLEENGVCGVDSAAMIDEVESWVKEYKLTCQFYSEDPEIMEEMKRRGLHCLPLPPAEEEADAVSGLDA